MLDSLDGLQRSHSCGVLRSDDIDKEVVLMGWVQRRRDHGGLIFVDLRDREGLTQVVFNPDINDLAHAKADMLRSEFVIAVRGIVIPRPEGMANPNLPTGEIEVAVEELRLLNTSQTPPFELEDFKLDTSEAIRLRYRYLDLRRPSLMHNLLLAASGGSSSANLSELPGIYRSGNPDSDQKYSGGGSRLPGSEPNEPGKVFRPAAIASAFQTTPDDGRNGAVLSTLPLFPG